MKKSELKTGMLVVTREGNRAIVLKDTSNSDIIAGDGISVGRTWSPLNFYKEDLTYTSGLVPCESDIVEIWSFSSNKHGLSLDTDNRNLLWKREEIKKEVELTLEEIAAKFNINIQQLKIKK